MNIMTLNVFYTLTSTCISSPAGSNHSTHINYDNILSTTVAVRMVYTVLSSPTADATFRAHQQSL